MNVGDWTQPRYQNTGWQTRSQQPTSPPLPLRWSEDELDYQGQEDEFGDDFVAEQLLLELYSALAEPAPPPSRYSAPRRAQNHGTAAGNHPVARQPQTKESPPPRPTALAQPDAAAQPKAVAQPAQPQPKDTPAVQTQGAKAPSAGSTLNLPPRPEGAMTGKQFLESTKNLTRPQREARILQEIQHGNVPDFARQMKEIQVNSKGHSGTLKVMPDYLAIGSDKDFVRIPMDAKTAQKIADQTGTSLPTTKIVDDVYKQADTKLAPQPLPAGAQMMSNDYTGRHNDLIEQQMGQRGAQLGDLTAGHQKDLVISNRLTQKPDRVAIYGWHQQNGKPIQGLSTVHESTYADYSHGVRLVGGTMMVDGVERPVSEVLKDPALAALISNEGALRDPRVPGV